MRSEKVRTQKSAVRPRHTATPDRADARGRATHVSLAELLGKLSRGRTAGPPDRIRAARRARSQTASASGGVTEPADDAGLSSGSRLMRSFSSLPGLK